MQGLYVDWRRPKSKKEVKEIVAEGDLGRIGIEATSLFGNEYGGPLSEWEGGDTIYFVGPDPHTKRNFYGTIELTNGKVKVK